MPRIPRTVGMAGVGAGVQDPAFGASFSLETNYRPHAGQMEVHTSKERFRVLVCGRQWGKSICCLSELTGTWPGAYRGALQRESGRFWFVTRTFSIAKDAYLATKTALMGAGVLAANARGHVRASDTELSLWLTNGTQVEFRSADNPDLLRGSTLDGLVIDEASLLHGDVWNKILRPALGVRRGWVIIAGTARGARNWLYDVWKRGHEQYGWRAWSAPTSDNPFFDREEFDQARRELPDAFFRQEYLAEFLTDSAGFFGGLDAAYDGAPQHQSPLYGWSYVLGVDLGQHNDYTVVCVIGIPLIGSPRVCSVERWRGVDWSGTEARIVAIAKRWTARAGLIDATGVGGPVAEAVRKQLPFFEPFVFSSATRLPLLGDLALTIQQERVRLAGTVEDPGNGDLDSELRGFGWHHSRSGKYQLGPSPGGHDDCVMALALANRAAAGACGLVDVSSYTQTNRAHAVSVFGGVTPRFWGGA